MSDRENDTSVVGGIVAVATQAVAGVPAPVSKGLWKAFSRLLALPVDSVLRPHEDKLAGQSIIRQRLATQAAELAASDPHLVERTLETLMGKEMRRLVNKEKIVEAATEDLKGAEEAPDSTPSDDWLNTFERYAEDTSDEDVQKTWAKVLSGEIRNPGSWSKKTLRLLSELDQKTAQAFRMFCAMRVGDVVFKGWDGWTDERYFSLAMQLESEGLIHFQSGQLLRHAPLKEGVGFLPFGGDAPKVVLTLDPGEPSKLQVPCVVFTPLGLEMARLEPAHDQIAVLLSWAPKLSELAPRIGLMSRLTDTQLVPIWSRDHGPLAGSRQP